MRDRFPLLVIGGLLLLAFLGSALFDSARRGDFADRLSTWRSGKEGARALYVLAEESGVKVTRHQADLLTPAAGQPLVILGVEFAGDREHTPGEDEQDLTSALRSDAGVEARPGLNTLFVSPVSDDEREKLLEHVRSGASLVYVPPSAKENALLSDLGLHASAPERPEALRTLVPPLPTPYTLGVQRVEAKVDALLELPGDATPLLVDDRTDEVVMAHVPFGAGQVIVLGSADLAMNHALLRADNAQLWLSLLRATAGERPAAFDEYHHGFAGDRSIAEFARRYGLQYAIAQLLVGLALWALALKRFGRPRAPPEDQRIGTTDALYATSRLYREGRHHPFAAQLIVRELSQELARAGGVPLKSEPAAILLALRDRDRQAAAALFERVLGASQHVASEDDVRKVATLAAEARALIAHRPRTRRKLAA